MKTNQYISKDALANAFYCICDVEHLTNEIIITVRNTEWLNSKLIENRRSKIHSIAFSALFEIVKNNGGLPKGYYISNPQMKKFVEERFEDDYKSVLADACRELEIVRNNYLNR